jgi:hypothetical protein
MQYLEFNLIVKTTKSCAEIMHLLNALLNTSFSEKELYEKGKFYTTWKSVVFGLEISLTYYSDTDEYYLEGFPSVKVIHLVPVEQELAKQTDISNEMQTLFKLAAPEDDWILSKPRS